MKIVRIVAVPIVLIAAYQLWSTSKDSPFFPSIGSIAEAFRETWLGSGFALNVVPSLRNLAVGYLLGVVLGVSIGALLARWRAVRLAIAPLTSFALALPAVALVPLFITVAGVGQQMQQSVIAFSTFIYMLVNTADGLARLSPSLRDVNEVFGITGLRRLMLVSLPSIAPRLLGAGRATLSLAVLIMVVSEMVGASAGIGAVTLTAQQSFQYDVMWSGMVLVAILGVGLNGLYSLVEKPLLTRAGLTPATSKR